MYLSMSNESLVRLAQQGDTKAFDYLVEVNMPFIHSLVQRYIKPKNKYYEDIMQEGVLGFLKAVKTFDSSKGYKLLTYACHCIENEFKAFFRRFNKYNKEQELNRIIAVDKYGNNLTVLDFYIDKNAVVDEVMKKVEVIELEKSVKKLPRKLQNVVHMYYFENKTQFEIAKHFKVSQSYVSRLIEKALNKLKDELRDV